jgi:hypothetical protein
MEHMMSVFALAVAGALVGSAGAHAAQADNPPNAFEQTAAVMGPIGIGTPDPQRDVIEPPSSIDPGMTLDPPQTGARMPIIHPPGTVPGGRLILPR